MLRVLSVFERVRDYLLDELLKSLIKILDSYNRKNF